MVAGNAAAPTAWLWDSFAKVGIKRDAARHGDPSLLGIPLQLQVPKHAKVALSHTGRYLVRMKSVCVLLFGPNDWPMDNRQANLCLRDALQQLGSTLPRLLR